MRPGNFPGVGRVDYFWLSGLVTLLCAFPVAESVQLVNSGNFSVRIVTVTWLVVKPALSRSILS